MLPDLLLDATILVDLMRDRQTAIDWLKSVGERLIGVPVVARMELIVGCRSAEELRELASRLNPFADVHIQIEDSIQALRWLGKFKLSHGLGIHDALIAAPAARLGLPLYTLNLKHFRPLPGVDARKPY